ncbi:hypothetical protein [Pyrobaculum ferrireducens]|uniref:Uncharacterized protein n=1 Tax=Pyrobaculum ferrireducens TaxID=1104324 RepID=G7VEC4_9CREN|nr:hypothetical protein [Pyrobaculum ferrireducens]AET34094.1 hypothetical protein P186_2710 [Pyrobaculum ferrireducens]
MLPPSIKTAGLRNLLFHFPRLAYYVLVAYEGGDPVAEAERRGDPPEVGRYVDNAVRSLEREVLAEVLERLAGDEKFAEAAYRELAAEVLKSSPEAWEAAAYFAKFLYPEMQSFSSLAACQEAEELAELAGLLGVDIENYRKMGLLFETWDSVLEKKMLCTPRWLEKALGVVANAVELRQSEETSKLLRDFVGKLFHNPRGYAAFRADVFRDVPVIPQEALLGQPAELPGVFNGRRVNPLLREAAREAIIEAEKGRAPGGALDREFGVYIDGSVVYAPVPEAVGHKMLAKYRGAKIVAVARWPLEAERYAQYLKPYGVEIVHIKR